MIEAKNISVSFGESVLLRAVDATVRPGELLVIAGSNGAGKTTLLRVLSGELAPSMGSVTWEGRPFGSLNGRDLALRRAYLAQQTVCTLPFSALEIVILGAETAGLAGTASVEAARRCMGRTGTAHLEGRLMETLSGGEQQRVHWARVLAQLGADHRGKCLFLDEPISSLDLAHQHHLLSLAQSVAHAGAAVVAVLHDLNLAAEYADRLLLLRRGALVCDGSPGEVFTAERIETAFGLPVRVETNPVTGTPWIFAEKAGRPVLRESPRFLANGKNLPFEAAG